MGCTLTCSVSSNAIVPDPNDRRLNRNIQKLPSTENSAGYKSIIGLTDIIIDKSCKTSFAQYLKEEKRLIEEEVLFLVNAVTPNFSHFDIRTIFPLTPFGKTKKCFNV
jgi:hypothetical protein